MGSARAVAAAPGRRSDLHKLHTKERRPPGWWRALALGRVRSHGYMRQTPRTWQTRMRLCDGSRQKVNASQRTLSPEFPHTADTAPEYTGPHDDAYGDIVAMVKACEQV